MLPTFLPGLPPLRGRCSYFAFLCLVLLSSFPLAWGEEPDFASQIKPILANHCWSCHGPDEQARQGDLRLDRQEDAWGSLKVLATDSQPSSLVARIESSDPTEVMPPPESKKTLSTEQRALLTAWVNAGAKYSQHWSFVPPRMIDQGAAEGGSKGEVIDRLVRDRLSKEGLRPSAPARPETLLRRVSLDLTGLPPTIEELNRFLEDKSEDAYEKAVDRLLASDAYAERMAAHWLDLARYADTNGYNNDEDRQMWPWRDWLIRAFRDNMPMDRFIREMLAGDMLPDAKLDQQIATGFLRNQGHNTEGGIIQIGRAHV